MDTIEYTDKNFKKQLALASDIIAHFKEIKKLVGGKYIEMRDIVEIENAIMSLKKAYNLSAIDILVRYYDSSNLAIENEITKEYYVRVISDDFQGKLNFICRQFNQLIYNITNISDITCFIESDENDYIKITTMINDKIKQMQTIQLTNYYERKSIDLCKCGSRLEIRYDTSEMWCENCQKSKQIVGATFKEDNNTQDVIKTKNNANGTTRHYTFWITRIQALEKKTFLESETAKIEELIKKDNINRLTLNCEKMREILKDPSVNCTHLNQNASLLVKLHGGPPPPVLSFAENQILSIKFKKAMAIYEQVVPGSGNKPYYPYFIYKLVEEHFKDDPEKLRILDYIHLQSKDTLTKDDLIYKQMAALAKPEDGIVYRPTDVR